MTGDEEDAVVVGMLDYREGKWVHYSGNEGWNEALNLNDVKAKPQ